VSLATKHRNPILVDLTEQVSARTTIPQDNHPALRSGFAGFPPNPRWNLTKYRAWKVGCQWRSALTKGEMVVRSTDSMLVVAAGQDQSATVQQVLIS